MLRMSRMSPCAAKSSARMTSGAAWSLASFSADSLADRASSRSTGSKAGGWVRLRVFACDVGGRARTLRSRWLAWAVTGWVRIPFTDVIRTRLIAILMPAKMQLPEGVRGPDGFLSEFYLPQGNPTQPVIHSHVTGCMGRNSFQFHTFTVLCRST